MEHFIDTHMSSGGGSMVGREDVAAKRSGDDNQHEELFVILDRLVDDDLAI